MPLIKKDQAGSDSFGNTWPEDGAAIEVTPEQAEILKRIVDGGFSEVLPEAESKTGRGRKTSVLESETD